MVTEADECGRISLPKAVRERFGERYRIVKLSSHVALFPVDADPAAGILEAVGDAFDDVDPDELRDRAHRTAYREIGSHRGRDRPLE